MRFYLFLLISLVAACLLTACSGPTADEQPLASQLPQATQSSLAEEGQAQEPPTATRQPPGESSEGQPGQSPVVENIPEGAVIVYRRSGGFAGLDEEWTIYADGRVTSKDGRQWQASPEQASDLIVQIEALGFFEIKADPIPLIPCCDRFYYELTMVSGEQAHTIATYDGAPATPPGLWQAMEAVIRFLDQAKQQPG
ncbi:MAG: hypothetical protein JXA78_08300 [Anaerolineales bacterium]|nr:hypothetical protein [Anaerolineales bacterium]